VVFEGDAKKKRVYVGKIASQDVQTIFLEALHWLGWEANIKPGIRIFLKPNFTYPFYKEWVSTLPRILEVLVAMLTEMGAKVWIGESDGGSYAWTAEEAFEGHQVSKICVRYGTWAVNLSRLPREIAETNVAGCRVQVELPSMLLHDNDVFVRVPAPKVHVVTGSALVLRISRDVFMMLNAYVIIRIFRM